MACEINYEEKQCAIIKKSIPILIQQIKNGNPFRPCFKESQLNCRFFRKHVYNLWNIVTDEDLSMEYEDEDIWAEMFVDYLMDCNNSQNLKRKEKEEQPSKQDDKVSVTQTPQQDSEKFKSTMQKPKHEKKSTKAENAIGQNMDISMEEPNINEMKSFITFAIINGFLKSCDIPSELVRNSLTLRDIVKDLNSEDVKAESNMTSVPIAGNQIHTDAPSGNYENQKSKLPEESQTQRETKRKWTLNRIFRIICPCLKPKN